jgi:outer membrane biosynthesis protein TonB
MAHTARLLIVAALASIGASAQAQTLNQPSPVDRLSDVTQFGVPRDAKYIFCDGADCPERSIKHLHVPPPPPPAPAPVVIPQPQSIQPPVELSPAKVEAPKSAPKKKPKKRAKPKVKYECKPVPVEK